MGNPVETVKQNHWSRLEKYHGKRIPKFFYRIEIPQGLVVDELPEELKEVIKAEVIPLTYGGKNPVQVSKIKKRIERIESNYCDYNERVFVLAVPDRNSHLGYTTSAVLESDLYKQPSELYNESLEAQDDTTLFNMKRCAYIAVSGNCNAEI